MGPAALLIQEELKIGIRAMVEKIPGANWRTAALVENKLPLHLEIFGGWLNTPDYYFCWAYLPENFNSTNYDDGPAARQRDAAHGHGRPGIRAQDPAPLRGRVRGSAADTPLPARAQRRGERGPGYEYWSHHEIDVRPLGTV
jgi:peptide/nickel transport system substrate-binding protein